MQFDPALAAQTAFHHAETNSEGTGRPPSHWKRLFPSRPATPPGTPMTPY